MEKLIELLNEYCKEKEFNTEWYEWKFWPKVKPYEHLTQWVVNWIIIWNHYWFIKRLVENDKIDIFKSWIDELPAMFGFDYESVECKSDRLVMMLSIQNEPITFLVSILK